MFKNRSLSATVVLSLKAPIGLFQWQWVTPLAVVFGLIGYMPQAQAASPTDTFYGTNAGHSITSGVDDSAFGYYALYSTTSGSANTASGTAALESNTTGSANTASGDAALESNTTGSFNTATGESALVSNTTGSNNEASGAYCLFSNTTGNNNMGNGANALYANTTGFFNMANGSNALFKNTLGNYNVAEGLNALYSNSTGSSNIAIGTNAGGDLTTGNNNIEIGNRGAAAEANTIRIGTTQSKAFFAGVRNAVVSGGMAVYVSASGQLGTNPSSKRFKQDIAPMAHESEAILQLKPVSFRYKKELDPQKLAQFGLIAEEVAQVAPDLVVRDAKGQICAVRYDAINAMLLNEFLKAYGELTQVQSTLREKTAEIEQLKATVATQTQTTATVEQLKSLIARQEKAIAALRSHLQEVDAKVALNQSGATKVVTNE